MALEPIMWVIAVILSLIAALLTIKITGLDQQIFKKKRTHNYFYGKEQRFVRVRDASYWGIEGTFEIDRTRASYDEESGVLYLKGVTDPLPGITLWPQDGANLAPAAPGAMAIGDVDADGNVLELMSPTEHPIERMLEKKYAGSTRKPSHTWESEKRSKDLGLLLTIDQEEKQEQILQSEPEKEERFIKKLGDVVEKMAKLTKPQERTPPRY